MGASRIALVTGGTGGIGAACARALAADGFRVALTYRGRAGEAADLAAEIDGHAYALDLQDRAAVRALAARLDDELGPVQVLVHAAGIIRDGLLPFLSDDDWEAVQAVDLAGPFFLTKALVRGMLRERWGRVIAVASVSGVIGQVGQTHYSAAKGGLIAFVKALAREVARYGVTANAVAPGLIDTDILSELPEKVMEDHLLRIPLGRLGRPEEVAALVRFLASEEGGYVTGQTWRVDGGLAMA